MSHTNEITMIGVFGFAESMAEGLSVRLIVMTACVLLTPVAIWHCLPCRNST